jgi:hypothetical protein
MRVGKLTLIVALAGAVLAPSALAAPGKLIAKASDSGLPLAVSTTGRVLQPKAILVRITATPNETVEVSWDTSCSKGPKGKVREGDYLVTGPDLVRIRKTFKRPTDCLVNVFAAYQDAGQAGRIKIEIFARGRFARRG